MADWKEKWNKIWKNQKFGKDSFLIMILGGMLLLVIALPTGSGKKQKDNVQSTENNSASVNAGTVSDIVVAGYASGQTGSELLMYTERTEERLKAVLEAMEGVGKVEVMITYASGYELVPLQETTRSSSGTEETDASGGTRTIQEESMSQQTVYTVDEQGNQIPYVISTNEPEIIGVAVCAQGGGDPAIQRNITEVIQSLFRIEANRIIVTRMKS
ncbi:MAG: hypothetical protein ACI4SE_04625 [Lachnospiraceae bacterium]